MAGWWPVVWLTVAAAVTPVSTSALTGFSTYDSLGGAPYAVNYTARAFTINGAPTLLLGGAIHPPRAAYGDWANLLAQMKVDGLNMVQIYVFWNFHERSRGEYDFDAGTRRDLGGFIELAGKAGLFVTVRIGPYVCAEWDGGGLPLWLRDVENFTCSRCDDPVWETEMATFVRKIGSIVEPYLPHHGGPVVLAQIENELHNPPGSAYVEWCGELAASLGFDVPWVMCNGASANNTVNTCNGNTCGADGAYADTHASKFPDQPMGWTEDWSWFATWGTPVTDHPGPYMADNIAIWFAKGGSHHVYYMWYGGNHIEHWAASGLTNRYGDGSNIHSDTLPNEPKRSHLAALHTALATMAPHLVLSDGQTRSTAVAVVPCPAVTPPRQPLCVNGTNGTGNVACSRTDPDQAFTFTGGVNKSGLITHTPPGGVGGDRGGSSRTGTNKPTTSRRGVGGSAAGLCVSGACPTMTNVSGCAPLPLVPCDPTDPAQQWTWEVGTGPSPTMWMVNTESGGCLSGWSKHAVPGVSSTVPFTGVAACATGWGTAVFDWNPTAVDGLLINAGASAELTGTCLSATHPVTAPVLAYEYKSGSGTQYAAFIVNTGGDMDVRYNGGTLTMPGGSISLVLADVDAPIVNELFNTHVVNADGIACNRSYTTLAPGNGGVSGWQWWPEPVPPVGGTPVQSAVPTEQLALTHDQTEFMYYAATLPASTPAAASKAHGANSVNLTIGTREASAFALFVGGEFVGSTDDHTKGPNPVTLTLAVPPSAKARDMVLLSTSLGIQNFHGTNPLDFAKGIVGSVTYDGVDITKVSGGWTQRPGLGGELRAAAAPGTANASNVEWGTVPAGPGRPLSWYRATFATPAPTPTDQNSTLLLDAGGLTRGHYYVNGHDLGRYWTIGGYERYYYIPRDTLMPTDGTNSNVLVVFDELGASAEGIAATRVVVGTLSLPEAGQSCPV
eukprot:m.310008 g.310008  ORF g.310008 m.310008 type:complete len:954 (-) comp27435_c0_seq3:149-3010(-)